MATNGNHNFSAAPEPAPPLISVIICTYNRAHLLAGAIRSVLNQTMSREQYEILVVDNGSTDGTRVLIHHFATNGGVQYLFEDDLGLCQARNTGWKAARGRYVAFLDDDAVASPGWLAAIEEAFSAKTEIGIVGGRVTPIWEEPRPAWLADELVPGLAIIDWSQTPAYIANVDEQWLVGANMAIRRTVLIEIDGFHPSLDRSGTQMLSNGDILLQKEILRRGYLCFYHPDIAVEHFIPKTRLAKSWFEHRYFWQGLSDAQMQLIEESLSATERLYQVASRVGKLLRSMRKLLDLRHSRNDPEYFTEKCFTLISLGHVFGLLGPTRNHKPCGYM